MASRWVYMGLAGTSNIKPLNARRAFQKMETSTFKGVKGIVSASLSWSTELKTFRDRFLDSTEMKMRE
jgi:hypothetical protein